MSKPTAALPFQPGPNRSPQKGTVAIRAFFFDTYGTVCDFFQPFKRALSALASRQDVERDTATLAIAWRNAYMHSVSRHVAQGRPFRPLFEIQREDLAALVARHFPQSLTATELDEMTATWRRLDAWPDVGPGLSALRKHALVAPLSNGNFDDMAALARHAGLPWDVIVGSSLARQYKPHPDVYLSAARALNLAPEQTCMVAAHQFDLHFAAGHGMQTAFVMRPLEFGGAIRPAVLEPDVDYSYAAEMHAEADWTYVATDFLHLAQQHEASLSKAGG
jgi:2-haloacid dehalogenase